MKKVILFLGLAAGLTLAACSGKSADQNAAAGADTIVVDNGTVQVDSIAPDSAEVTVTDTAAVLVAEPAK
jgi:ABC-type glycerol-3-phosphate transport system substrate-binding protein